MNVIGNAVFTIWFLGFCFIVWGINTPPQWQLIGLVGWSIFCIIGFVVMSITGINKIPEEPV